MPLYPTLPTSYTQQQVIDTFMGYNHNLKINDGEWYETENLTSDYYPLLANRRKRGFVKAIADTNAIIGKSELAYIDGTRLWYGGNDVTEYLTAAGAAISDDGRRKQMVSMGAYICIFPDKLYFNTENFSDCGSMEGSFDTPAGSEIVYTLSRIDGSAYLGATVSSTAPASPANGALWIDSSGDPHVLKQYSAISGVWTTIPTVYTRISATGIGANFKKFDGVTISGCRSTNENMEKQVEQLNGTKIIYDVGDDYIVVVGIIDEAFTQSTGSVSVTRTVPDMDYVTEAENRLWGCKYGVVDGETVNEIYCCALGDFKNWSQYLGLSTDSYTASVGTDGAWTGATTLLGYPIFFKEDVLHKVYISSSGAHRIVDTACRGVQEGSANSLQVVNATLYYKSRTDIMAYDGSIPVSVSQQLGNERYYDAAAGALGDKYYVSMTDESGRPHMFAYDTAKGLWHHEDNTRAMHFARVADELYFITEGGDLMTVNGSDGEQEGSVKWSATTGLMGYNVVEHKYVSRFNIRMQLPKGSDADLYLQYDSDGLWHHQGHINGAGTSTFMVPVRPRRCDHFRFRIEGEGDVRIYSIAKIHETGSDV